MEPGSWMARSAANRHPTCGEAGHDRHHSMILYRLARRLTPGIALSGTVKAHASLKEPEQMPRELIETHSNKRFVRRDARGRFTSSQVDVGGSLSQDRRKRAKRTVPK